MVAGSWWVEAAQNSSVTLCGGGCRAAILADDDGDDNCIVGTLPGTIAN